MPSVLNKTLRLFLDSIGRRDEYEFYLEKFTHNPTPAFALLSLSCADFEDTQAALAFDLEFLRRLELHPAVVLSGTDAGKISEALASTPDLFTQLDVPDDTTEALADAAASVQQAVADSRVPVFTAAGMSESDALARLIPGIARRVHFIRVGGPLRDTSGTPLNYFYVNRATPDDMAVEDRDTATQAAALLAARPQTHVSVCAPWQLLPELFTVKGAGCLVRRASRVLHVSDIAELDRDRTLNLLAESFGREPNPATALDGVTEAFIEEHYRGAMLLVPHDAGMYLSKFAVGTQARGEGLANELWREATSVHGALFWRARRENPINHTYARRADGYHTTERWRIYWIGIRHEAIPAVIDFCANRPEDFIADSANRTS